MSWATVSVGDVTSVVTKGTTPKVFAEEGINYVKAEALNGDSSLNEKGFYFIDAETHDSLRRSQLMEGDVLLTIAGAKIGKCGIISEAHLPANTNQAVGIMRPDRSKAHPRFLYYFFKQPQTFRYIQGLNSQAAQPNINLTMLKRVEFKAPDIEQQKIVADALSSYDDLIENNRRRIALLEASARLLYKEWFVHLRFPGHEHVKVVDGVPEGWEQSTIHDVAETIGGGTPSTKVPEYWDDGDIVWFSPTDLTANNCLALLDSRKKITETGLKKSSAKTLPPETILMSSRASIGYFGLYEHECCTNQGFISCVPRLGNFRMYLLHNLMSRVEEIIGLASGTTFKEISKTNFRAIPISVPPSQLLEEFEQYAYDAIKQVRFLKKQMQKLVEARDLLLPRLMNGEIEV